MFITMRKESGFTLVELLVGLAVGLLVLSGILSIYITVVRGGGNTLKSSRLNQEMSALMNIMANDIRRAGYWNGGILADPLGNPFSQTGSTALEVHALAGTYANAGAQGNGSCIVYAYDLDKDGTLGTSPSEGFGFRWDGAGSVIKMRRGAATVNDCNVASEWDTNPMTDGAFISVENLNFSLADSSCLNTSEPNDVIETSGAAGTDLFEERDCYNATYAPDADEVTVEIREVLITLTASLVDDPSVRNTMVQSVKVRNNHIRKY